MPGLRLHRPQRLHDGRRAVFLDRRNALQRLLREGGGGAMTAVCHRCGAELPRRPQGHDPCCLACRGELVRERRAEDSRRWRAEQPDGGRVDAARRWKGPKVPPTYPCKDCGAAIEYRGRGRRAFYCSECAGKHARKWALKSYSRRRTPESLKVMREKTTALRLTAADGIDRPHCRSPHACVARGPRHCRSCHLSHVRSRQEQ